MRRRYMILWLSYIDEIYDDDTTLADISKSVSWTLKNINRLILLEKQGKIKVKKIMDLLILFFEILDKSIDAEVINNPIVDIE
jgi:hypothetical protein